MVSYTAEQAVIIEASKNKTLGALSFPKKYKCHICHLILKADQVEEEPSGRMICSVCHQPVREMCYLDHCHCSHDVIHGLEYCPICGDAICPECGSHDVSQVSRVTGYLAEVGGFNKSKAQELKDRTRYVLHGSEWKERGVS
jgi:hypothetical protein